MIRPCGQGYADGCQKFEASELLPVMFEGGGAGAFLTSEASLHSPPFPTYRTSSIAAVSLCVLIALLFFY